MSGGACGSASTCSLLALPSAGCALSVGTGPVSTRLRVTKETTSPTGHLPVGEDTESGRCCTPREEGGDRGVLPVVHW